MFSRWGKAAPNELLPISGYAVFPSILTKSLVVFEVVVNNDSKLYLCEFRHNCHPCKFLDFQMTTEDH